MTENIPIQYLKYVRKYSLIKLINHSTLLGISCFQCRSNIFIKIKNSNIHENRSIVSCYICKYEHLLVAARKVEIIKTIEI